MRRGVVRACRLAPCALVVALLACGPEEEVVTPIDGALFHASGASAPLTSQVAHEGTGLSFRASLGGELVEREDMPWGCFAPDGEAWLDYDLESTDGDTYGFFVRIDPDAFETGDHPIDGERVKVTVSLPDRYATAQTGVLSLRVSGTAADAPGSRCAFTLSTNLRLAGERDE